MELQMTKAFWRYCLLLVMAVLVAASARPGLQRRAPAIYNTGYGYQILRPDSCRSQRTYVKCYLCGKIADDKRIYDMCCKENPSVVMFCDNLVS